MNQLHIIGNVTRDAELRSTPSGTNVCSFSVAVNERRGKGKDQQTTFFKVSAWNALAETCGKYVKKGMKISVVGRVGISTYTTQNGENRSELTVMANDVEFLTRAEANDNQSYADAPSPEPVPDTSYNEPRFTDVSEDIDSDLPF